MRIRQKRAKTIIETIAGNLYSIRGPKSHRRIFIRVPKTDAFTKTAINQKVLREGFTNDN